MRYVIGFLSPIVLVTVWPIGWIHVYMSCCLGKLWVVLYVDELTTANKRLACLISGLIFLHDWLFAPTCIVYILAHFENIRYPWCTLLNEVWVYYSFILLLIKVRRRISVRNVSCCVHCHQSSVDWGLPICLHGGSVPCTNSWLDPIHWLLTVQGKLAIVLNTSSTVDLFSCDSTFLNGLWTSCMPSHRSFDSLGVILIKRSICLLQIGEWQRWDSFRVHCRGERWQKTDVLVPVMVWLPLALLLPMSLRGCIRECLNRRVYRGGHVVCVDGWLVVGVEDRRQEGVLILSHVDDLWRRSLLDFRYFVGPPDLPVDDIVDEVLQLLSHLLVIEE